MDLKNLFSTLLLIQPSVSYSEKIISFTGAFIGILFLAGISDYYLESPATPLMIASMGASAVLLFAAPHSPMAQPWAFVGGHLISALIGVTCYKLIPHAYLASAVAVATAILVMHMLRCLHPPGGATALTTVIGGQSVHALGYAYVLTPVALNVTVFLLVAMLFNQLAPGRRYPMVRREVGDRKETKSPGWALGKMVLSQDDLEAALKDMNAYIDVTREDLGEIYTKAALHALRRRMGEIHCRDIMARDVVTAEYASELEEIWELMRQQKLKGVPVIDRARRVIGIVTIIDFLKRTGMRPTGHVFDRLRQAIRRTPGLTADKPEVVGEIMSTPPVTAFEDQHIANLIPMFSEHKIHHLPIVNQENKLVGMVTQTDLMVALYRHWAAMA